MKLTEYIESQRTARGLEIKEENIDKLDLQGLSADELNIHSVTWSEANLSCVNWRNCHIHHASFPKIFFREAMLRLCHLENVQAHHGDFTYAKFENSSASGCVLDGADFSHASFIDSDLSRASLQNANLQHAVVTGLNLRGANLQGANLSHIDFAEVDLRGADLSGANLEGSSFDYADIRGAIIDQQPEETNAEENRTEENTLFSPPVQELADSLSPIIANLLKQGNDKELISQETFAQVMQQLHTLTPTVDQASTSSSSYNDMIQAVLTRAGDAGIEALLDALHSDSNTPNEAVATLLRGLSSDLQLDSQATTEDLFEQLTQRLHKTSI